MNRRVNPIIFILSLVFTIHFIFTYGKRLKRNDFGTKDQMVKIIKDSEELKLDLKGFSTIGYMPPQNMDFDQLAIYYTLRYILAPNNLRLFTDCDTVLYYRFSNNQPKIYEYQANIEGKLVLLKNYSDKMYLLRNE